MPGPEDGGTWGLPYEAMNLVRSLPAIVSVGVNLTYGFWVATPSAPPQTFALVVRRESPWVSWIGRAKRNHDAFFHRFPRRFASSVVRPD